MVFSVLMPYPFFNLISIFTSAFLLYWFLCAINRFFEVIALRVVILSGRLVYIRGLNSYLRTFSEMSSQSHINSIIHTRQSNPPIEIKSLNFPIVIESANVIKTVNERTIEINIASSIKCYIYILIDFNNETFKSLLSSDSSNQAPTPRSTNSVSPILIRLRTILTNLSKSPYDNSIQRLVELGICSHIFSAGSLRDDKVHKIQMNCPSSSSIKTRNISPKSANTPSIQSIALIIISEETNSNNNIPSSVNSSSKSLLRDVTIEFSSVHDTENVPSTVEYINPLSSSDPSVHLNNLGSGNKSDYKTFGLGIINLASNQTNENSGINLSVQDSYIYSTNGIFYNIQEIFGLKLSVLTDNNKTATNSSNSTTLERTSESRGIDEECVVCLTDKKNIALLPCRHLCVCQNCLTHIDKCPVCRTNFDEYISINNNANTLSIQIK